MPSVFPEVGPDDFDRAWGRLGAKLGDRQNGKRKVKVTCLDVFRRREHWESTEFYYGKVNLKNNHTCARTVFC